MILLVILKSGVSMIVKTNLNHFYTFFSIVHKKFCDIWYTFRCFLPHNCSRIEISAKKIQVDGVFQKESDGQKRFYVSKCAGIIHTVAVDLITKKGIPLYYSSNCETGYDCDFFFKLALESKPHRKNSVILTVTMVKRPSFCGSFGFSMRKELRLHHQWRNIQKHPIYSTVPQGLYHICVIWIRYKFGGGGCDECRPQKHYHVQVRFLLIFLCIRLFSIQQQNNI